MNSYIKKIFSVLISFILAFSVNLIAIAENQNLWKNKIDEKIYEEAEDKDSVIPVYIWLTDVDHEEVISETEKTLGYGEDDLAVVDEYISEELAVAISNLSEKEDPTVKDELQQYMKKTEKKRKAEKEKTDKYISEKRSNYRDEYNKKSKDFLEKAKISDEEIIFRSQYAPMIIAEITLKQIEKVAKYESIMSISFYEDKDVENPMGIGDYNTNTKLTDLKNNLNLHGTNVRLGVVEGENITITEELPASRFNLVGNIYFNPETDHVQNTAKILAGNNGVADNAIVYSSANMSTQNYYEAIEHLLNNNVVLINSSYGFIYHYTEKSTDIFEIYKINNSYVQMEKWVEHIALMHNVSFVVSAGNDGLNESYGNPPVDIKHHRILSPGNAYNVITVGACNTNANTNKNDDEMYDYSSFDEFDGCEKPDIVAPADIEGGGTSSSAPFVSGIIALMIELRPSLAAYPQAVKAILLASCHHKAAPATGDTAETMVQGITDKQGAGVVDAYRAISITGRGNYGVRSMSGGVVSTDVKFNVPNLYGAEGINVSIAWLKNNSISGSDHNTGNVSNGYAHNLNLEVFNGSTSLGTSTKNNSSTEMVYINSPTNATYTIRINKVNSDVDTVKVGYAWSFSKEQFYFADDCEGIFLIKNKNSGKYLNYSNSDGVTQKNFMLTLFQRWVVYKKANGQYTINSFVGKTGCLDVNNLVNNKYYSISLDSTNVADVAIFQNSDGSVTISKTTGGYTYQLCVLDNSTSDNVQAVWKRIDSASDLEFNQQWYLEPICYQIGDVNRDGSITADDARTVLQYSSGTEDIELSTSRNVLIYLADADSDGQITAADARLILRISARLE